MNAKESFHITSVQYIQSFTVPFVVVTMRLESSSKTEAITSFRSKATRRSEQLLTSYFFFFEFTAECWSSSAFTWLVELEQSVSSYCPWASLRILLISLPLLRRSFTFIYYSGILYVIYRSGWNREGGHTCRQGAHLSLPVAGRLFEVKMDIHRHVI